MIQPPHVGRQVGRLTPKQQAFVFEYLKDLNATQAAARAGYSPRTARQQGQRLLTNVDIQKLLAEARAARQVEARVESERLEREAERISVADFRQLYDDRGRFLPIHEIPADLAAAIASIETVTRQGDEGVERIRKIRFWDKNVAQRTLFQLRGDGKVNEKNVKLSGELRLSKLQEENQLAMKHMTQSEFERASALSEQLLALFQAALARAPA